MTEGRGGRGHVPAAAETAPRTSDAPVSSDPSTTASRPLVLVPRPAERAVGLVSLLRRAGLETLTAPVIAQAPPEDTAPLDAALRDLTAGVYPWAAVTSAAGAAAVVSAAARLGVDLTAPARTSRHSTDPAAATRSDSAGGPPKSWAAPLSSAAPPSTSAATPSITAWAAVGPATARELRHGGLTVGLIPGRHSARGLIDAFRGVPPSRILLALGDLAAPTLANGLAALGWRADAATAYRTIGVPVPDLVRAAWSTGAIAAVVLTSGSVARQVAAQLGPRDDVVGVAIGEPSARTARESGLRVVAVARAASDAALTEALVRALRRD